MSQGCISMSSGTAGRCTADACHYMNCHATHIAEATPSGRAGRTIETGPGPIVLGGGHSILAACSLNEDFGRPNQHFRVHFRSTFQGWVHDLGYETLNSALWNVGYMAVLCDRSVVTRDNSPWSCRVCRLFLEHTASQASEPRCNVPCHRSEHYFRNSWFTWRRPNIRLSTSASCA